MYTLGIETSCDETSCAVLKDYKVLSCETISSLREHRKYGGVIPEIATRAHLKTIDSVLAHSLAKAKIELRVIDLIAVTHAPGLIGALVVGLNFAKALALTLHKPFIGVNHLHAHIFAPFLNGEHKIKFPFLGVVISGGHTELYEVRDFDRVKRLGGTRDDAAGEVYDKIAYAFGLGYPGGPAIDRIFDESQKHAFSFKCGRRGLDLSFSGIKTALLYKQIELQKKRLFNRLTKIQLVSSFQESVVTTLVETVVDAARAHHLPRVVFGGGVMANQYLRKRLIRRKEKNVEFFVPPIAYAQDNAAIVAGLGFYLYNTRKVQSDYSLQAATN